MHEYKNDVKRVINRLPHNDTTNDNVHTFKAFTVSRVPHLNCPQLFDDYYLVATLIRPYDRTTVRPYERTSGRADERTSGRADERTSGRADERTSGRADERTSGRADERTSGRADERTSGRADERTSERASGRADERTSGRSNDRTTERPDDRTTATCWCRSIYKARLQVIFEAGTNFTNLCRHEVLVVTQLHFTSHHSAI